jgi:hypothetical protein
MCISRLVRTSGKSIHTHTLGGLARSGQWARGMTEHQHPDRRPVVAGVGWRGSLSHNFTPNGHRLAVPDVRSFDAKLVGWSAVPGLGAASSHAAVDTEIGGGLVMSSSAAGGMAARCRSTHRSLRTVRTSWRGGWRRRRVWLRRRSVRAAGPGVRSKQRAELAYPTPSIPKHEVQGVSDLAMNQYHSCRTL